MSPIVSTLHGGKVPKVPRSSHDASVHEADASPSCGLACADDVSMATYLFVSLSTAVMVGAGLRYAAMASIMLGVGAKSTSSPSSTERSTLERTRTEKSTLLEFRLHCQDQSLSQTKFSTNISLSEHEIFLSIKKYSKTIQL